jgi:hypothetical protein
MLDKQFVCAAMVLRVHVGLFNFNAMTLILIFTAAVIAVQAMDTKNGSSVVRDCAQYVRQTLVPSLIVRAADAVVYALSVLF